MSVFLLLLGIVTTAAGLALVASAATIDTDIITPGTVAAVGGLLLIGLALAVRELQRIEQALVGRPLLRAARAGETTADVAAAAEPPVRIPFPPKPKINSQAEPPVADATAASAAESSPAAPPSPVAPPAPAPDEAFERLRAKFPNLVRLEHGAAVDAPEASMVTQPPTPAERDVEVKKTAVAAGGRTNGAAATRMAPRLDTKTRPAALPERAKSSVFNAFWPAVPRRDAPAAAQVAAAGTPSPSEPAAVSAAAHDSSPAPAEAAVPVSALKSGVVEGMAYTLYSDGSIEAQLPQGKLRFGSITALRKHIERGA